MNEFTFYEALALGFFTGVFICCVVAFFITKAMIKNFNHNIKNCIIDVSRENIKFLEQCRCAGFDLGFSISILGEVLSIVGEEKAQPKPPEIQLELQLVAAEQCEDYEKAARLRDLINNKNKK